MRINVDFECGGGKRVAKLAKSHWRLETSGDASGYTKYFCAHIVPEPGEPGALLQLDVHPDAELGDAGRRYFRTHFPSTLWIRPDTCDGWLPFREVSGNAVIFHGDWFEAHIAIESGTGLYFATNPPLPYSNLLAWTKTLAQNHGPRMRNHVLGVSVEGREIPVLLLPGSSRGLPRFLVMAGQHPSEHGGCVAALGIAEYLLSPIAEAREILGHFDFAVIPMINPDGNARGLSGANAQDIDLAEDFAGVAEGSKPRAAENRILWQWLQTEFKPDVLLDLHAGLGCLAYTPPTYDGAALFVNNYNDPRRRAALHALQERFRFDCPSYPAPKGGEFLSEKFIEYQAASAFGTLAVLFHVNAGMCGPHELFRRGPQLLKAMAQALLRDTGTFPLPSAQGGPP